MDLDSDDNGSPSSPGSPTPIRRGIRKVEAASPSGSPRRGKAYGDRYIPSRNGINLQAAFSLAQDQRSEGNEDFQNPRRDSSGQLFNTLLKAELFGDEVPTAIPSSVSNKSLESPASSNSGNEADGRTPPRPTRSAPTTPNKNIFRYSSPARMKGNQLSTGSSSSGRSAGDLTDSSSDIYSTSPVRMDSQRLLLSRTKKTRAISKVPYKVLDAPELADDFYLNLVDWGSKNVLGVGLASSVYLWHAQSGKVQKLCDLGNDRVTSVSWLNRGTHIAVGTHQGLVQIWDAESRKRVRTMTGHDLRVGCLAWNEHILTSGSRDKTILHHDVRVPQHFVKRITEHKQEVCGLKWNVEENQLASGSNDNKLIVYDGLNDHPLYKFDQHLAAVKAIAWSPHQRGLLASGGGTADQKIRFWNTLNGTLLSEVKAQSQVCNLAWSKNSNEIVSTHGFSQNQVIIWKYPSLQQVAQLTGHSYRVLYLAMSPDGRTIVTGAGDETLRFWNVFDENKSSKRGSGRLDIFQQLR